MVGKNGTFFSALLHIFAGALAGYTLIWMRSRKQGNWQVYLIYLLFLSVFMAIVFLISELNKSAAISDEFGLLDVCLTLVSFFLAMFIANRRIN